MSNIENYNLYSISDMLLINSKIMPEKVAYYFINSDKSEISITYDELNLRVNMYAYELRKRGIKKGSYCMLSMHQGIELIIAFLSCNRIGAISIPIDEIKKNEVVDRWINISHDIPIDCIITTKDKVEEISEILDEEEDFEDIPVLSISINKKLIKVEDIDVEYSEIAFLQYTSGSTSFPKGVMITNDSLLSNQKSIKESLGFSKNSITVTWLPFYHDTGLIYGILQSLYVGGQTIIMSPATFINKPILWIESIAKYKGTHTIAPNFAFELIADILEKTDFNNKNSLESLQRIDSIAEPVRINTVLKFNKQAEKFGAKILLKPCYGLAESTLIVSSYKTDQIYSKWIKVDKKDLNKGIINIVDRGYVTNKMQPINDNDNQFLYILGNGYANDGERICIKSEAKEKLPCNELGEVCVYGNSLAKGYLNKVEENKNSFPVEDKEVCLHTGDLGFIDEEGDLFITGRIKDLIIIRGVNYYPQDLEKICFFTNDVLKKDRCAAFYLEEKERLILVQEIDMIKGNYEEIAAAIRNRILEGFNLVVDEIIFVKPMGIPRTISGKIQRNKVKKLYIDGQINDYLYISLKNTEIDIDYSINSYSELVDLAKKIISSELGLSISDINFNKTFMNIGLSSIMLTSICSKLEELFNKHIDNSVLFSYPTLELLCNYIWYIINENDEDSNEEEEDIETLLEMELGMYE